MSPTPKAIVILGSLLITGWMGATIVATDVDNWADDELSQMKEAGEVVASGSPSYGQILLAAQEAGPAVPAPESQP